MSEQKIFFPAKEAFEEFSGEERKIRGVCKRRVYNIGNAVLYDCYLDPTLQEGYSHLYGLEILMLQRGDIEAILWDNEVKSFRLKKPGDMIVFLPSQKHTLFVRRKSHAIIIKNIIAEENPIERIKTPLPSGLQEVRNKLLAGEGKKKLLRQAEKILLEQISPK